MNRLRAMQKINIGMKLAEIDFKIRGPGEIYGHQQHGFPELKVASFADRTLIEKTRKEAAEIINQINRYPRLQERLKNYTMRNIEPN